MNVPLCHLCPTEASGEAIVEGSKVVVCILVERRAWKLPPEADFQIAEYRVAQAEFRKLINGAGQFTPRWVIRAREEIPVLA
jgi:hypothetical protein